jgi:hypothetical protein
MTKNAEKKDDKIDTMLFVFGLDEDGKPRGARFAECRDEIVNAALNMGCWVVYRAPEEFGPHGMKLPVGRLYASGRAFIPNIRRALYDKLLATHGDSAKRLQTEEERAKDAASSPSESAAGQVRCVSPVTSGLPRYWDDIGVGHMVLVHQSAEDGWWEAVVIQREDEILTLRFRDYPRLPTLVRHISAVALVNPGPPVQAD